MSLAIVTTLVNAERVLATFIEYHYSRGADHFFLFFDDPSDTTYKLVEKYSYVTCIMNDTALHQKWEELRSFDYYHQFINTEVMARQTLNMEIALHLCRESHIDYILHIDIDELFYCKESIREYFNSLNRKKIFYVKFFNHEVVQTRMHVENYFLELTLFKKNYNLLDTKQQELVREIFDRRNKKYFLFYSNGKVAVRVTEAIAPTGIRDFQIDHEQVTVTDAVILHYPCCGFQHYERKYTTLKHFADKWFGKEDISTSLPIHIRSRDVIGNRNTSASQKFYQANFIDHLSGLQKTLLAAKILTHITIN